MDVKRAAHWLSRAPLLVVLSFCSLASSRHCHHHQYWDSSAQLCRPCTRCPLNQIIRKPCHRHSNTVCGPFREFSYFHQLENPEDASYTSYEFETLFSENSSGLETTRNFPHGSGGRMNEPVVEKDDGEYWKSLAFALIGVVCILIFVATVVVLIACRKLHETAAAVKHPEEDDDDDSGYVVIRSIRPPNRLLQPGGVASQCLTLTDPPSSAARALLLVGGDDPPPPTETLAFPGRPGVVCATKSVYVPKRQLLSYDADDVFGSGDSLASGASCSGRPQDVVDCAEDRAGVCSQL